MSLNTGSGPVWCSVGRAHPAGDAEVAWDVEPPEGPGSYAVFMGEHRLDRSVVGFARGLRGVLTGHRATRLRSGRLLGDVIKQALAEGIAVRASVAEHGVPSRLRAQVRVEGGSEADDEPTG